MNIEGKVAVITGGASGLGLAMARSFVAAGLQVAIADIEQDALDATCSQFFARNPDVIGIQLDVTDRDAMEAAACRIEHEFGPVHVVCNNAGVAVGGPISKMSYEDWDWVLGVNLTGVINGIQTFLPRLEAHGQGGHIVNTASMSGLRTVADMSVYHTAKFAVVGLSEAMRQDLAETNIGVSVLCPGVVDTNIVVSGRNRPAFLQAQEDTASLLLASGGETDAQRRAAARAAFAAGMDPSVIGDMVLHAIRNDEFYILSHAELKGSVAARTEEIMASFERWAHYRERNRI